jgi:hypothetical protein
MTLTLLVGHYNESNSARRTEFFECLRRNIANEFIEEVHVFLEDGVTSETLLHNCPELESPKVKVLPLGHRLTYSELIRYANDNLAGRSVVIANADIHFDRTLERLESVDLAGKIFCLSRWDVTPDGGIALFDHPLSQDAWIFRSPVHDLNADFHLGVLGCDNRFAWEAESAGLQVLNPSRIIRACHLHASMVRNYTEGQRLHGNVRSVVPSWLGVPWISFVVPCRGRLDDLRVSLPPLLEQARSSCIVVDYSCPQQCGTWIESTYPEVTVVRVPGLEVFHGAEARNAGARAADADAILCFLDADVIVSPGFSTELIEQMRSNVHMHPDAAGNGLDSCVACHKQDFVRCGGFDENLREWGDEVTDFRTVLNRAGIAGVSFASSYLSHRPAAETRRRSVTDSERRATLRAVHGAYRRAKDAVLRETGGNGVSYSSFADIYRHIDRHHRRAGVTDAPLASVRFSESMGYTIARMQAGVSSHNNELRPFRSIPEPLLDRAFTQVVANSVSPVKFQFLDDGKIFVLIGTDWGGYEDAKRWLQGVGYREPIPLISTEIGTGFEAWSIHADAMNNMEAPTQVVLVGQWLERL